MGGSEIISLSLWPVEVSPAPETLVYSLSGLPHSPRFPRSTEGGSIGSFVDSPSFACMIVMKRRLAAKEHNRQRAQRVAVRDHNLREFCLVLLVRCLLPVGSVVYKERGACD